MSDFLFADSELKEINYVKFLLYRFTDTWLDSMPQAAEDMLFHLTMTSPQ